MNIPFIQNSSAWQTVRSSALIGVSICSLGILAYAYPTLNSMAGRPVPEASASAGDPLAICVNVFRDFDSDGVDDGTGEPPIQTVTITAYDAANTPTLFTLAADGSYTFTPGDANLYRIEVTGLGDNLEPSVSDATTTFFSRVNTTVDLGLHTPQEFYPSNSSQVFLTMPCYVDGASNGANRDMDVLLAVPASSLTAGAGNASPTEYFVAEHDEVGATFGVAYSRPANALFASAFTKRHTAFGPSGTGAIYKIELNGSTPTVPIFSTGVTTLVDLNALFGANTAGVDPHPNVGTNFNTDPNTFAQVGKVGLGGLAHDGRTNTLWTINLADRKLYEIPLGSDFENPTAPAASAISIWPATGDLTDLPGLMGTTAQNDIDIRPFALKYHRGDIYIGLTATGESSVTFTPAGELTSAGDRTLMRGYIYKFDPSTDQFTQLLSFPFNYSRGQAIDFCSNNGQAEFNPWVPIFDADDFLATTMGTIGSGAAGAERVYPQPWITDIEFDEDGKMLIGIRDRFADQHGYAKPPPNPGASTVNNNNNTPFTADGAGDVLVATLNLINQTTYVLESNSGNGTNGAPFGPSRGLNRGEGPGNGEFFYGDRYRPANAPGDGPTPPFANCFDNNDMDPLLDPNLQQGHDEVSLGGIFNYNGQNILLFSAYDPLNDFNFFNNAGVISMNNREGGRVGGNQIYATTPTNNSTFAKGNGLGDVEGIAAPAPIAVGNRVWLDVDRDGLQDADEPGLNGVTVTLFRNIAGNFEQVASTTTSANAINGDGNYTFSNNTVANQTWTGGDTRVLPDSEYRITVSLASAQAVNPEIETFTQPGANTSNDNKTDINDSDADPSGAISFSTGTAGQNNPTLDAGVVLLIPFDLALVKRLDGSTPGPFVPGDLVTFEISLYNQGEADATDVEVKDYVPPGLSLAPASAPTWTESVDTAILTTPIDILAGATEVLTISFIIDAGFMDTTLTNNAEISAFDDDNNPTTAPPEDEDSTPNNNGNSPAETATNDDFDDDNPNFPGTIDNPADEDDFDPETISILQSFDLALVKRIDQMASPGPFTFGSSVTFTIEVINQGTLDGTDIVVTDYIPDGLSLVPSGTWNEVNGNAVLATPADVAAGARLPLTISFTIDEDFTGNQLNNLAEITAGTNALMQPDEDSTPGDNDGDGPETGNDDNEDDDGANGNGNPDNMDDADDFDFAPVEVQGVGLGSTVFLDNNNDGLQNGADAGLSGVEVQLFNAQSETLIMTDATGKRTSDPAEVAPVLTDADGNYFFSNLVPGNYYIVIPTAPTDVLLSSNNTGIAFVETDPDDDVDNDDEGLQPGGAGTLVTSDTVTLSLGAEPVNGLGSTGEFGQGNVQDDDMDANGNMTLDFGFFAPVMVGDSAFVDLNGDGLQTPGEPGIGGITVALLDLNGDTVTVDAEGNAITGVTTTAADGSYFFTNLPPGSYSVVFDRSTADDAENYAFTIPNAGGDDADSDNTVSLTDSIAQSNLTGFLNSGEQDRSFDVGLVCNIQVTVADPFAICSTQAIDLTAGASISPDGLGGSWSSPNGSGVFTTGTDFNSATTYLISQADAQRGSVTLILTSNDPAGPCEAVSNQLIIQILKADCGEFFWDGE